MSVPIRRKSLRAAGAVLATALLLGLMANPASAVPTVTGYLPGTVSASSATNTCQVAITGTEFVGVTNVRFFDGAAGVNSLSFVAESATQIVAQVPATALTGPVTVFTTAAPGGVAGPSLTISGSGGCPTISSFTPLSGAVGTLVTVTGTNFTGASLVKFGAGTAGALTVTATSLTATVPTGATTGPIRVLNGSGWGSSAQSFTVPSGVPTISSFSPTSGPVGTSVTINGTNLTGATSVTFNNVAAAAGWTVNATGTQITGAIVPASATDGLIRVVTPGGTAVSATNFDVTGVGGAEHPRTVSFGVSGNKTLKVKGTVTATDGYANCEANVGVKIQKQKSGGWKTLTTLQTNDNGNYKGWVPEKSGKYRAKAPKVTLLNDAVCGKDTSPTKKA